MVIGIDNSPSMVDAARAKGIDARQGNAERLPELFATDAATGSPARFDAVFSNAALHWVRDQDAMLRGVARVLRPGGRFVFEMGGHGNIAAVRTALRAAVQSVNPLKAKLLLAGEYSENYFPTAAGYSARLQRHGFTVRHAELIARPTVLGPGGIRGWYRTFRNGILSALTEQEKEQVLVYAEDLLKAALFDEDGTWIADYVRLRVSAQLQ
jgi:SAM-dependent methyltransferase